MGRNTYFQFKQFRIEQENSAMKVGTDSVLLGAWVNPTKANTILDIGAGTGLLSLMMAQRTDAKITAVELDGNACLDAGKNFLNSKWSERITLINKDIQDFAESYLGKFDLIITNPPYFTNGTKPIISERDAARHQNDLTSEGIVNICLQLLSATGKLALILPVEEGKQFIQIASTKGMILSRITKVKPNPVKPIRRYLMEFSKNKLPLLESELMLENERHHDYTEENRELCKEFYLKF